ALTGWQGLPILILSASSFGLLSALYFLKKSGGSSPMQTQVPFGPFLALGAAIYILWGESIWAWYLG
ncbi:MAG: prepilin peptidase, partial [Desulfonatronovibrionaceae bacterium]